LKRAGMEREIARPKGWRGSKATSWLEPAEAFAVINEAYAIDAEFGLFCLTLLYTGMRLSDPLNSRLRDLKLDRALLYVPDTKNREPRPVHLPCATNRCKSRPKFLAAFSKICVPQLRSGFTDRKNQRRAKTNDGLPGGIRRCLCLLGLVRDHSFLSL